jgi:hypothetical protein
LGYQPLYTHRLLYLELRYIISTRARLGDP